MFYWAAVFLIVAIVAGMFGFGGTASTSGDFAKIAFFAAIILFLVSAVSGGLRRGGRTPRL